MFVIGITGGIGSGKTKVSAILEALGAIIVNADLLGHEAYRPRSQAWQEIVGRFGEEVLAPNREVDRKQLGSIVFDNPEALQWLNAIVHPHIYEMLEERIGVLRDEGRGVLALEAALLFEANWTPLVNEVWATVSSKDKVVQRLLKRDNLAEEAIRSRINSQMTAEERTSQADVIIENDGSLDTLRERVEQLWYSRVLARNEDKQ